PHVPSTNCRISMIAKRRLPEKQRGFAGSAHRRLRKKRTLETCTQLDARGAAAHHPAVDLDGKSIQSRRCIASKFAVSDRFAEHYSPFAFISRIALISHTCRIGRKWALTLKKVIPIPKLGCTYATMAFASMKSTAVKILMNTLAPFGSGLMVFT